MHFRLKVPSGEYGSIFVAIKRFFIMSGFHFMQLMSLLMNALVNTFFRYSRIFRNHSTIDYLAFGINN